MTGPLEYRSSDLPDAKTIAALYDAASLRRPTSDPDRIARMVQGSNVTLACFERREDGGERLVGFLRGWTDFAFDGYVCDLAVHPDLQHRGIGRELLARATSIGAPEVQWVLLEGPVSESEAIGREGLDVLPDRREVIAKDYYAHIGWEKLDNAWKCPREGFVNAADPAPAESV